MEDSSAPTKTTLKVPDGTEEDSNSESGHVDGEEMGSEIRDRSEKVVSDALTVLLWIL